MTSKNSRRSPVRSSESATSSETLSIRTSRTTRKPKSEKRTSLVEGADAAVLANLPRKRERERMEELEDEIYLQSLDVVQGAAMFVDIDPLDDTVPREWIDRYGRERAERLYAAARAGHSTKKDAPIGLSVAMDMVKSERRARSGQNEGPKTLNIAVVALPKVSHNYDDNVIYVDNENE